MIFEYIYSFLTFISDTHLINFFLYFYLYLFIISIYQSSIIQMHWEFLSYWFKEAIISKQPSLVKIGYKFIWLSKQIIIIQRKALVEALELGLDCNNVPMRLINIKVENVKVKHLLHWSIFFSLFLSTNKTQFHLSFFIYYFLICSCLTSWVGHVKDNRKLYQN